MASPPHDHRRDLELVLVGVALTKGDRQRVLAALPAGAFGRETGELLESIRSDNPAAIRNWLDVRGAVLEKGRTAIDAAIHAVLERNKRERLCEIIQGLQYAAKGHTTEELQRQVRESLKELEGMV